MSHGDTVLVHLGAGIGNVVLATPLLLALHELGFRTDVLLAADYAETADLLRPWAAVREVRLQDGASGVPTDYRWVIPAIPPFYAARYGRSLARAPRRVARPPDAEFSRDEQNWYLTFARALGYPPDRAPATSLPIAPSDRFGVTSRTVVLAPGCKTGEMAAKRWPRFVELAESLADAVVVGTFDDLKRCDGSPLVFPPHLRSFVGALTLRETAELMASAGAVVGNDSGLSHVAAALGVPTIMLFGPTPHTTLGRPPGNAHVLRCGLACEPCWNRDRFVACRRRIDCLAGIGVARVQAALAAVLE